MSKIHQLIVITLVSLLLPSYVSAQRPSSKSIDVTANIEGSRILSIYGFSSPESQVTAESPRVYAATLTDEDGSFRLENIGVDSGTQEVCLTATDERLRTTSETCIPVSGLAEKVIGPVLLSPTISLNTLGNDTEKRLTISGKTIPDSEVFINFSKDSKKKSWLISQLIPTAYAYTIPSYDIKADHSGNFSLKIAATSNGKFRIFAKTFLDGQGSPKSRTLTYSFPSLALTLFIVAWVIGVWSMAAGLTFLVVNHNHLNFGNLLQHPRAIFFPQ